MNGITLSHPTRRLLRLPEVESIVRKSKSAIYADPTFPKPIKIGPRASAWIKAEDLFAWVDARIEASRQHRQAAA